MAEYQIKDQRMALSNADYYIIMVALQSFQTVVNNLVLSSYSDAMQEEMMNRLSVTLSKIYLLEYDSREQGQGQA